MRRSLPCRGGDQAGEAVSEGLILRLVLKGGESVEGIPDSVDIDASNRPGRWTPKDEEHLYGPMESTIQVGSLAVLAQEVREFTLSLD